MAIYIPGKRNRHGKVGGGRRSAVAYLNMTAMVDMFTVLCVFLLQNYATTNQVLPMPDKVDLPAAHEVKELKPSNVVIIGEDGILLNNYKVAELKDVKAMPYDVVKPLKEMLDKTVRDGKAKKQTVGNQISQAVSDAKNQPKPEVDEFLKITVQADKNIDFLTVKKIMLTVTEAGMQEINFAVLKKPEESTAL